MWRVGDTFDYKLFFGLGEARLGSEMANHFNFCLNIYNVSSISGIKISISQAPPCGMD